MHIRMKAEGGTQNEGLVSLGEVYPIHFGLFKQ